MYMNVNIRDFFPERSIAKFCFQRIQTAIARNTKRVILRSIFALYTIKALDILIYLHKCIRESLASIVLALIVMDSTLWKYTSCEWANQNVSKSNREDCMNTLWVNTNSRLPCCFQCDYKTSNSSNKIIENIAKLHAATIKLLKEVMPTYCDIIPASEHSHSWYTVDFFEYWVKHQITLL